MVDQRESKSLLPVAGVAWASRISSLAFMFAVPTVAGFGLDRWWRTAPILTVVGAILGFLLFMAGTLRMAKELSTENDRKRAPRPPARENDQGQG